MPLKANFTPAWTDTPPAPNSFRSIFKWGDPNGFKHPNARLFALLKQELNMADGDFTKKQFPGNETVTHTTKPGLATEKIAALAAITGAENIDTSSFARVKYASGKTSEEAMLLRRGKTPHVADLAVHPRGKADVKKIVAYCHTEKIPLTVYGGGSSVTFGLASGKGGVVLVMTTHMNRQLAFNEADQTITVEPGMLGPDFENLLNRAPELLGARRAYTGGHFPQSFEYSTVGGWIAALGSGQQSSYYGDAYDLVLGQEYVTPTGDLKTLVYPGTATGPKVNDMLKGSEGAFGVLVAATMKIFRYRPENRQKFAFIFPDWTRAVDACREISQGEFGLPAMLRISDPEESAAALKLYGIEGTWMDRLIRLKGLPADHRCLCIGHTEGEAGFSRNVKKCVKKICRQHKGLYISGYPVRQWEHGRFADPYLREDLNDFGITIETLETAVTWDNLHRVHQGVRAYIKNRPETICMTHSSHFYPQGTNLYFIFISRFKDTSDFRRFHRGIIDQILAHGGSLSHHHGVGKMVGPWMERHLGKCQMDVLRALKRHFDPHNIMNPGGTLGLD